jgi:hypothetical protein
MDRKAFLVHIVLNETHSKYDIYHKIVLYNFVN